MILPTPSSLEKYWTKSPFGGRDCYEYILGYEMLPLCIGHLTSCLPVSIQTLFNVLPPADESHTGIGLLETFSLNFTEINNTNTGKPNLLICEIISYKHWKYSPPHWNNCHASAGKLLVSTHFSFIDWDSHGCIVYNCPEDWNRTFCDCINKIVWQNSPLYREHHMKGLIAWHDWGVSSPRP
jgi:hypothetical protein